MTTPDAEQLALCPEMIRPEPPPAPAEKAEAEAPRPIHPWRALRANVPDGDRIPSGILGRGDAEALIGCTLLIPRVLQRRRYPWMTRGSAYEYLPLRSARVIRIQGAVAT